MKKKLSAIFLDIDDTLYSTTDFTNMARRESLKAMCEGRVDMTLPELTAAFETVVDRTPTNYAHHFDDLIDSLPKHVIKHKPSLIVATAIVAHHRAKHRYLNVYEDALHVIRQLSKANVTLGIITAGLITKQSEKIIRLGLEPYVAANAIFITEEIGLKKEESALYSLACKSLNFAPETCMIIGDSPTRDIDPPNQIGMITVWNKRSGKHLSETGRSTPDYVIHNFWDLEDILENNYDYQT